MSFSMLDRAKGVEALKQQVVDVAIIGGGINGTGIARDAAGRGLKTVLFEAKDLAWGTSSRSSRMIHGGLRYLEHYEFGLVHESVGERWNLLKLAPHLVKPLPFLFPVYKGEKPGIFLISMGTLLYSFLSSFRTPGKRSHRSAAEVAKLEPTLLREGLTGAAEYYDCATDDARLTLETAIDAQELGATILSHCPVVKVEQEGELTRLTAMDQTTGKEISLLARSVALAGGPWTDSVLGLAVPKAKRWLRPTKGVHLVFKRDRLPVQKAVVMKSTHGDKRISFAVPWGDFTYVGTTDTDFPDPSAPQIIDKEDVEYLIGLVNYYFPNQGITNSDVISTWAGLRPLVAPEGDDLNPSDVSREERIETLQDRFVVVAGGKLTTYRVMCAQVVDQLQDLLSRRFGLASLPNAISHRPLPGAQDLGGSMDEAKRRFRLRHPDFDSAWVDQVVDRYGSRSEQVFGLAEADPGLLSLLLPGLPVRLAEVHHAVLNEMAFDPADFLIRRTSTHYTHFSRAPEAFDAVATVFKKLGVLTNEQAEGCMKVYLEEWRAVGKVLGR